MGADLRGAAALNRARPRIKVCCIRDAAEAALAIRLGADALGLVGEMPSGPGVISDESAREIAAGVPPPIATFLLTSRQRAAAIVAHQRFVRSNTLQLVDRLEHGTYAGIRDALPGIAIVQVIHVQDDGALDEALAVEADVDAILLDSGNTRGAVKELGGTGRVHDWKTSRSIVERVSRPVFLAGGLTPANIREAREAVGPYGFDVCSGVRTNGALDEAKLARFIARAWA